MTRKQIDNVVSDCPVEVAINIISGKWKAMILSHLMKDTYRFNELKRALPNISQRMLTSQLRDLEEDGLVNRKVYAEIPPKVEYSLTKQGRTVRLVLEELHRLGEHVQEARLDSSKTS